MISGSTGRVQSRRFRTVRVVVSSLSTVAGSMGASPLHLSQARTRLVVETAQGIWQYRTRTRERAHSRGGTSSRETPPRASACVRGWHQSQSGPAARCRLVGNRLAQRAWLRTASRPGWARLRAAGRGLLPVTQPQACRRQPPARAAAPARCPARGEGGGRWRGGQPGVGRRWWGGHGKSGFIFPMPLGLNMFLDSLRFQPPITQLFRASLLFWDFACGACADYVHSWPEPGAGAPAGVC